MIILLVLAFIALAVVVNMALTGITIWAVNEIFSFDMPFWPVFWLLAVAYAVIGGSSRVGGKN